MPYLASVRARKNMKTEKLYRSPPSCTSHPYATSTLYRRPVIHRSSDWSPRPEPPDNRTSTTLSSARDTHPTLFFFDPPYIHLYILISSFRACVLRPDSSCRSRHWSRRGLTQNSLIRGLLICYRRARRP